MSTKKISGLALLIIVLISFSNNTAQAQLSSSLEPDEQREASKYENYYEFLLNTKLGTYYAEYTYIVDVKAQVKRALVANEYEINQDPAQTGVEWLPGLPAVPPELRAKAQEEGNIAVKSFNKDYRLDRLEISVMVDTSFTRNDISFIQEATAMTANINTLRGDRVKIIQNVFPRSKRAISLVDDLNEAATKSQVALPNSALNATSLAFDNTNPFHWVLLSLGALLLVAIMLWLVKLVRAKPSSTYDPPKEGETSKGALSDSQLDANLTENFEANKLYEKDRVYITNAFLSEPKALSKLFDKRIRTQQEEGILQTVRSLQSIDEKLLQLLKEHLEEVHFRSLSYALASSRPLEEEKKYKIAHTFRKTIEEYLQTLKQPVSGTQASLFDFLDQMSEEQIVHLVLDESDEVTALLLAQMDGARSSKVLKKLKSDKQLAIFVHMGKIDSIPVSVYKRIAKHFSTKALTISDMKRVSVDGFDSMLEIINSLPINQQDSFVDSIAHKDLDLAKRIRKFFVSFEDIPKLQTETLSRALENFSSSELVKALKYAGDPIVEKVLESRPFRERELIRSEIESTASMTATDIEEARKSMLLSIREYLKVGGDKA